MKKPKNKNLRLLKQLPIMKMIMKKKRKQFTLRANQMRNSFLLNCIKSLSGKIKDFKENRLKIKSHCP